MSFELRDRELLGRIGRLKTKGGTVETPAFMPVVNPVTQSLSPRKMKDEFGCEIVITNSYIIKRNFGDSPDIDVHRLIDFDGVVMTDSGAYQILVYGDVKAAPDEMIGFQQRLGSDIAVILDIPTGWNESRSRVEWTVEETLRRARDALPLIEGDDTLWVGPVQGGAFLDLVEHSARSIGEMPYQIHALGSPTEVMENYNFPVLVDMIMAAKLNLPPDRPFHLFGAGHPMMFSMAVALGCDLFDSAAYALYANEGRYMTTRGTRRLKDLNYLPCSCPVCSRIDAEELKEMLKSERIRLLTEHNLHICMGEMRRVKQAIAEGTLWELMTARSRGHPSLTSAVRRLMGYREALERSNPSFKGRGLFFFDSGDLARPEITRHVTRLETNFLPSRVGSTLLLVSAPQRKPFTRTEEHKRLVGILERLRKDERSIDVCYYVAPFGVVPVELAETYPLSQYVVAEPFGKETLEFTAGSISKYVVESSYREVVMLAGSTPLDEVVKAKMEGTCVNEGIAFKLVETSEDSDDAWDKLELALGKE